MVLGGCVEGEGPWEDGTIFVVSIPFSGCFSFLSMSWKFLSGMIAGLHCLWENVSIPAGDCGGVI